MHQPGLPPARSRPALPAARRTAAPPTSYGAACGTSAIASARGTLGRPRCSRAGVRCASASSAPEPTPWRPLRRGAAAAASSWPSTLQGWCLQGQRGCSGCCQAVPGVAWHMQLAKPAAWDPHMFHALVCLPAANARFSQLHSMALQAARFPGIQTS